MRDNYEFLMLRRGNRGQYDLPNAVDDVLLHRPHGQECISKTPVEDIAL